MGKILGITAAVVGGLILILAGVVAYAYFNLTGIIRIERPFLLSKVASSVGRPVQANEIHATLGWGITLDINNVSLADDPVFSQLPFVEASQVFAQVEFLPLLAREIKVTKLSLKNPKVRIIRDRNGNLNLSTLGKRPGA